MVINTPIDPRMGELETLMNEESKSSNFAPFFFSIKDGEKALIRPLLNMNAYLKVQKHEIYNPGTNKFDVKAVCAADLHLECQHCADAASNKRQFLALAFW